METANYEAYLRVRSVHNNNIVESIGLTSLGERHTERVMMGLLRNMSDNYYVDDSEVDQVRASKSLV